MIRFTLSCNNNHRFDSWFQSGVAYDSLRAAGHVTCAVCGSTAVDKSLMAPAVSTAETSPLEKLRAEIEAKADYVGASFAQEARDMHEGLKPARSIYGQARIDEARSLLEDGIPVLPLPFMPRKITN